MMNQEAMHELEGLAIHSRIQNYKDMLNIKYENLEKRIFKVFN